MMKIARDVEETILGAKSFWRSLDRQKNSPI